MKKQRWTFTKHKKNKLCSHCLTRVPKYYRRRWMTQKVFCNDECFNSYWMDRISDDDWFDPFHPLNVMVRRNGE